MIPKVEAATSGTNTFIGDTFDNGLSGWQYYGDPGYQLSLDNSTGVSAPSAHISGDAYLGRCSIHGMSKVIDISSYTGGSLTLGFNWRASSSGSGTTMAAVSIDDPDTGAHLFSYQLAAGSGQQDTGWQYYSNNIANYVPADKKLQVNLFLYDCWSANWDENNWYDNISLDWNNSPIPPNTPTNLNATVASSSQINLNWSPPAINGGSPITGYKIERSTDFGFTWTTIVTDSNSAGTSYSDTGLQSQYYTYRVSAINAVGTGPPSNQATANPNGGTTIDYTSNSNFTGTVNASETVIVEKGVVLRSNGITNYGYIRNVGSIQVNNTDSIDNNFFIFNMPGSGITAGVINNYQSGRITNENSIGATTLNNYGIYNGTSGVTTLNNYGTYNGTAGAITLNNYGYLKTNGGLNARGNGHIANYQTGVIDSYGSGSLYQASLTNYGIINSFGGIELSWGLIITNGTFNNHSTIDLFSVQGGDGVTNGAGGTFNNFAGAQVSIPTRTGGYSYQFYNSGTVNNAGTFSNSDSIVNQGTFNNNGTINQSGADNRSMRIATITNHGIFNNKPGGTLNNYGIFDKECGATYNDNGVLNGNPIIGNCTTNQVITLSPSSGPPGMNVTVAGNNFQPNHIINVMFYSNRIPTAIATNPSTITSNSTGGFTATFSVPSTTYTGHTVAPTDGTYSAAQTLTIATSSPSAPTGLNATTVSSSQVNLSWNTPTFNGGSVITNYNIYRSTSSGTETLLTTVGNINSYTDTGLTNGQTYFYKVTAINSIGESIPSNETSVTLTVSTTVPSAPQNLQAIASNSQISLSWSAPNSNGGLPITGYEIERAQGDLSFDGFSNSTNTTFFAKDNATSFNDTSLNPSTSYNYTTFAKNSAGHSLHSNTVSVTTSAVTPPPPTGITLNNVKSTSGTVSPSNPMTLVNFNTGTGNNKLLVVGISADNSDVNSVTFNGMSLIRKAGSFYNNDAEFWYLKNPTGTGDVVVTMNGQTSAVVGAYSFSGVNQTTPLPTSTTKHNTTPNSPNITITTKFANDWILDLPSIYGGSTLGSPTCTQQWDANVPDAITGASSSKIVPTPGAVTCKWTASSGDLWDDAAIEIKASN